MAESGEGSSQTDQQRLRRRDASLRPPQSFMASVNDENQRRDLPNHPVFSQSFTENNLRERQEQSTHLRGGPQRQPSTSIEEESKQVNGRSSSRLGMMQEVD
jgi:hypothetical protein